MRRLVPALLGVVLAALTPSIALAFGKNKITYDRFDWRIYRAPHFDVYYYPEEENLLDQVVSYAESQYVRLSQFLDHELKFRVPLIYYKTHVEFEQTNILPDFIPEYVGAFADPIEHRMVLPVDEPPDKLYALIGHELTHVFEFSILYQESLSRAYRANTPGWIMEGLASYLGQDEDVLDQMIIRDAVVNGLVPPIHRVVGASFLTYRFGHAAFDFIEERYGQEGVRNFLWEFRRSLLGNNLQKPIRDAFGVDGDEFDRQFRRFLQKKYLPLLLDKKAAEDYGQEIARPEERRRQEESNVVNFSPALSPSGELIAVMTNRWQDLDVAILSAKDGKVLRNLTRGFTNRYEYLVYGAFEGKKDITWSPEGDLVAFFARKEDERVLLLYDALRGGLDRVVSLPGLDDEISPAWSPDGKWIALEANQGGNADLFAYEIATGAIRNLTQDEFYDANPAWSPDGTQILYNRRIGRFPKVFLVDVGDPTRKVQLTFGESLDIQPSFSRDAKTVYYVSDAGTGIFNLHALRLDTGEIRRHTDVVGGVFTPLELPPDAGRTSLALTSYDKGRFRLFRVAPGEPEAVARPAEQAALPAELAPFQPPLQLTLDEQNKRPYDKLDFHVESAPSVLVGIADDGTLLSNAQIIVADLLGDHRMWFNFQSVSTYSNFFFEYENRKRRYEWDVFALDFRDYYVVQSYLTGAQARERQSQSFTGAGARISYPFNRYYRVGASAGYFMRSVNRPVDLGGVIGFVSLDESYPLLSWNLNGDTVRFKRFGPYHGQAFQIRQDWAPSVSASGDTDLYASGAFVNTLLDYRLYRRVTARSLFALRLAGAVSNGDGYQVYSVGGYNTLRGYEFREFFGNRMGMLNLELRFPLVDALAFPIGVLQDIRGFLFLDVATAWFGGDTFWHPQLGPEVHVSSGGVPIGYPITPIPRRYEFWDSENDMLADGRATYGFGFRIDLGPFQLTWSYGRQMENSVAACELVTPTTCALTRTDDPFHESGQVSSFYIGREF